MSEPLIIYAGAGLSISSGLPSGTRLAELLHQHLENIGQPVEDVPSNDLLAIADFMTDKPDGITALQDFSVTVSDFAHAAPSPQHTALALLVLEGAISLLTTNWDTCIERAVPGDHISAVVLDDDRMRYKGPLVYKVHGCALRPSTLLINTEQLAATPIWATADVAAALSHAFVVFVGIGDVAPYVRVRLEKLLADIGSPQNVRIVSPSIRSKWEKSQWADLLPDLDQDHKLEMSASDFADALLRAWVWLGFQKCSAATAGLPGLAAAFAQLKAHLTKATAPKFLQWLRTSRSHPHAAASAVLAAQSIEALLALGVYAKDQKVELTSSRGAIQVAEQPVHLVIADGAQAGPAVAQLARQRIASLRAVGDVSPNDPATVICAGYVGRLEPAGVEALVDDIVGSSDPLNVVDGPAMGPVLLRPAKAILEGSED